jgi:hypothetical protein
VRRAVCNPSFAWPLLNSDEKTVEVRDGHRRSAERVLKEPRLLHRSLGRGDGSGSNQPTYEPTKQPRNHPSSEATN